jgi:hypothetical protein
MSPLWPDLSRPPTGWTVLRQGSSLHLLPPGIKGGEPAPATLVVSPLVPVSAQLPSPEQVLARALDAERASLGTVVVASGEVVPWTLPAGPIGVRWEVEVEVRGVRQRRGYGAWRDATFLYGLHLLATPAAWDAHVAVWEDAASGLRAPE